MASFTVARSILRSSSARNCASRLASEAPAARSHLRAAASKRRPSLPIFRSPVVMSFCAESMMPYHTVTATALMTSMLSVSRRSYGWVTDACNDDL